MKIFQKIFSILILLGLVSCGGGGGGDSGSTFRISLDTTTISLTTTEGQPGVTTSVLATATGSYTGDTLYVGATVEGSGIDSQNIDMTVTNDGLLITLHAATGLAVGTYTGRVLFYACSDVNCNHPVGGTPLPINYTVVVQRTLVATPGAINFSSPARMAPASQTLTLTSSSGSLPWTSSVTYVDGTPGWLSVTPSSDTTLPSTVTLTAAPMSAGNYSATVTFNVAGASTTVNVTYTAVPGLATSVSEIDFAASPNTIPSTQSLILSAAPDSLPWSSSVSYGSGAANWLSLTPSSASTLPATITVGASALPAGTYQATISFVTAGATKTVTVNYNVGQRRLIPSKWGVGLANTTGGNVLTRTLTMSDNLGGNLAWTASSDAAWLSVTSSGDTASSRNIVLTADPTALSENAISYANVTVSSNVAGVDPAIIRVALWKHMVGSEARTTIPTRYTSIVADKIRPYVYANNGGTSIDVYNAHTAQLVTTISNVGTALGRMGVSPDGSRLYVLDTATKTMPVIDLSSFTKTDSWPLANAVSASTDILVVKNNGAEIVFVGDQTAYMAGTRLGGNTGIYAAMTATADGKHIFTVDRGTSPVTAASYNVSYSEIAGGTLAISLQNSVYGTSLSNSSNGKDVAVDDGGNTVYFASGAPYRCAEAAASDLHSLGTLPGGDAYPNNIEIGSDGRIICGISGWYSTYDFWVHSPTGTLIQGYKVAGYAKALLDSQLVVSPDGMFVITLTDDPLIAFVPIGL